MCLQEQNLSFQHFGPIKQCSITYAYHHLHVHIRVGLHCMYLELELHVHVVPATVLLECFASIKHLRILRGLINSQQ